MSLFTILQTTVDGCHIQGSTAKLRLYSTKDFFRSDGRRVVAGRPNTSDWFDEIDCTIEDNVLTIPQFSIWSTTDGIDTKTAKYFGVLFDSQGTLHLNYLPIANEWRLNHLLTSPVSWASIQIENLSKPIQQPKEEWLNRNDTITLISSMIDDLVFSQPVINVKDAGAKGDGITDDTTDIQAAANAAIGKTLYFPPGTFIVTQILLSSNTRVLLDPLATVRMKPLADTTGGVFALRDLNNVLIEGNGIIDAGKVEGALRTFAILVQGGSRLRFRDFQVQNADDTGQQRGDAIYLGVAFGEAAFLVNPVPTDVVIDGIIATNNDRQAISVIGAKKLKIVKAPRRKQRGISLFQSNKSNCKV